MTKLVPLKLKSSTTSMVRAYRLTFDHCGWATFYVDDSDGTLAIEVAA